MTSSQTRKEEASLSNAKAVSSGDEKIWRWGWMIRGAPSKNKTPSPEEDDNTENIYWQLLEARNLSGF